MLQSIFDVLTSIGNFFTSIVEFLISFIGDLVYAIKLIGETVIQIPSYLGFLPSAVLAIFITIFSIVVIYKILGRD